MRPLVLASLLAAPAWAVGPPPVNQCSPIWRGSVCAIEHDGHYTTFVHAASASKSSPIAATMLRADDQADEDVDLDISAVTNSGTRAVAGIFDLEKLANASSDLFNALISCSGELEKGSLSQACQDSLTAAAKGLDETTLESAALWGHGCIKGWGDTTQHSTKNTRLTAPNGGVTVKGRYLVVAYAEGDAVASITVIVTHHKPLLDTRTVCGKPQAGSFTLAKGVHTNAAVGAVTIDVAPQAGGTLGDIHFSGGSLLAAGTYTPVPTTPGARATLFFTGTVGGCVQPPSHGGNGPLTPLPADDPNPR